MEIHPSKNITEFFENEKGLFISTEREEYSVAINKQTGDIMLYEGSGDDCYDGCFISARNLLDILFDSDKIIIKFGKVEHIIGLTRPEQKLEAMQWVKKCQEVIFPIREKYQKADIIQLSFESLRGELPIKKTTKIYESIVTLSQYCASSLEVQKRYLKHPTQKAEQYLESCMAKAEKAASYAIVVKYPTNISLSENYGREITKRIVESIKLIQKPSLKLEDLPEWMNSNILESIAQILDSGRTSFRFLVEWAKDIEDNEIAKIDIGVSAILYSNLLKLSKLLKLEKKENVCIEGDITDLSAREKSEMQDKSKRVVKLTGYDERKNKRTVRVPLTKDLYQKAMESHQAYIDGKSKKILAKGNIYKSGFVWEFYDLKSFDFSLGEQS